MKSRALAIVFGAAAWLTCADAFACDAPRGQSIRHFYNTEHFGQLGVQGLGQNVHILSQYKCYDLSFLWNKNLRIYFNNASEEDEPRPTYIGAIILRVFAGKGTGRLPFEAYLYRNKSETESTSTWASIKSAAGKLRPGSDYQTSEVTILDDYFGDDTVLPVTNLSELNRESRKPDSDVSKQIANWHAAVVGKHEPGYRLYQDTAAGAENWFGIEVTPPASPRYSILRAYLTKYQASPTPRPKVFFTSGARSAECVYIRLIGPGDSVSTLEIERPEGTREFITLKMRKNANCEAP
jgi:hypothetical protein